MLAPGCASVRVRRELSVLLTRTSSVSTPQFPCSGGGCWAERSSSSWPLWLKREHVHPLLREQMWPLCPSSSSALFSGPVPRRSGAWGVTLEPLRARLWAGSATAFTFGASAPPGQDGFFTKGCKNKTPGGAVFLSCRSLKNLFHYHLLFCYQMRCHYSEMLI